VSALGEWAHAHLAEIDAAREAFDRRETLQAEKPAYLHERRG
jgi:hypothetical protein